MISLINIVTIAYVYVCDTSKTYQHRRLKMKTQFGTTNGVSVIFSIWYISFDTYKVADSNAAVCLTQKKRLKPNFVFQQKSISLKSNTVLLRPTEKRLKSSWFSFQPNSSPLTPTHNFVEIKNTTLQDGTSNHLYYEYTRGVEFNLSHFYSAVWTKQCVIPIKSLYN